MNKTITTLPLALILASCNTPTNDVGVTNKTSDSTFPGLSVNDSTPRVTGIGGIFFISENPSQTKEWYGKNLGLEIDEYGSVFEFRNANRPSEINYLRWSPFEKGSGYLAPSKKEFMINYRVQNIEGLVKN